MVNKSETISNSKKHPCQTMSFSVLDVLKGVLLEKASNNKDRLSIEKIEAMIDKFVSSPLEFTKFYDTRFNKCMSDNNKNVGSLKFTLSSATGHPCKAMGTTMLELLRLVLLEKAETTDGVLSSECIEVELSKIKSSPGDLPRLYDIHFNNCMKTADRLSLGTYSDKKYEKELKAIDAKSKPSVHTINLDKIKSKLGNRWDGLASKVYKISESCVRKHIEEGDTISRTKDAKLIICFENLPSEEASLRIKEIEKDISKSFEIDNIDNKLKEFEFDAVQWMELEKINFKAFEVEVNEENLYGKGVEGKLFKNSEGTTKEVDKKAKEILKTVFDDCQVSIKPVLKLTEEITNLSYISLDKYSQPSALEYMKLSENRDRICIEIDRITLLITVASFYANDLLSPTLALNISYETLNSKKALSEYLVLCKTLKPEIRKKLIFNLTIPSLEKNKNELLERFKVFKPFCAAQSIRIKETSFNYIDFVSEGFSPVIVEYSDFLIAIKKDIHSFKTLSKHLRKSNSHLLVDEVSSNGNIMELKTNGVNLFMFRN